MRHTANVCPVVSTAVAKKHTITVTMPMSPGHSSPPYGSGMGTETQLASATL